MAGGLGCPLILKNETPKSCQETCGGRLSSLTMGTVLGFSGSFFMFRSP